MNCRVLERGSLQWLVAVGTWAVAVLLLGPVNVLGQMKFRHHYVDRNLPGGGWGHTAAADLDRDGRPDFITGRRAGQIRWYRLDDRGRWHGHVLGDGSPSEVGAASLDVDRDGWPDLVTGGAWYRNRQEPRKRQFERLVFDPALGWVHDVVVSDLDGDGRNDVLTMSDRNNLRWYRIAADPTQRWLRHDIGPSVHAGVATGDLDGDGDLDVVRSNLWFENADGRAIRWRVHENIPFGRAQGPFPLATICRVLDLDRDGDQDLVMVENEIKGGALAWLENFDGRGSQWRRHDLPEVEPGHGAFHSLIVADFDGDGDPDVFTCEMEWIQGDGPPRWFVWENGDGSARRFKRHVVLDARLGGHEAVAADFDADGDLDVISKLWRPRKDNANDGRNYVLFLENLLR